VVVVSSPPTHRAAVAGPPRKGATPTARRELVSARRSRTRLVPANQQQTRAWTAAGGEIPTNKENLESGASRARTGDLLGAIQAVNRTGSFRPPPGRTIGLSPREACGAAVSGVSSGIEGAIPAVAACPVRERRRRGPLQTSSALSQSMLEGIGPRMSPTPTRRRATPGTRALSVDVALDIASRTASTAPSPLAPLRTTAPRRPPLRSSRWREPASGPRASSDHPVAQVISASVGRTIRRGGHFVSGELHGE
jgi:hypothetical protein